jgi:DNA-binding PadR family transcriptional regulator
MKNTRTTVFEILKNEIRQDILSILYKKKMKWKEIKKELEKLKKEEMNPNALTFHLRKLIETGFVMRYDMEGMGLYRLTKEGRDVVEKHLR